MCGIAGLVDLAGGVPDRRLLLAMMRRIAHRGPDGGGWLEDDGQSLLEGTRDSSVPTGSRPFAIAARGARAVLGHQRLAITDLSDAGRQPMTRGDGRYWIVFNGAIFNAPELRRELESAGERFTTTTDTEVLLASWIRWGDSALDRFNGMWAFAIWDSRQRELFASRDRYGIKPFYWTIAGDLFGFGSEPKALRAVRPAVPNLKLVSDYLAFGANIPEGDATAYEDYRELPAGSLLRAGASGIRVQRWYDLDARVRDVPPPPSFEGAAARLRGLLDDAIRIRLRADVPVGLLLSGGVDSSGIAGILAANHRGSFSGPAISLRYPRAEIDESHYSDAVLRATGIPGEYVEPTPEGFDRDLDDFVSRTDHLMMGSVGYAQYLLYARARAVGLPVILVGQGSDEIFGGYEPWDVHVAQLWNRGRKGEAIREGFLSGRRQWGWLTGIRHTIGVLRTAPRPPRCRCDPAGTLQEHQRHLLLLDYLPAILKSEDRNSMASAVESRLPFLDHRIVEFARTLPSDYLCRRGWTKAVLRRALEGLVPEYVLRRPRKLGLPGPLAGLACAPQADAARRRLVEGGWFPASLLPEVGRTLSEAGQIRLRILDAWARTCLDGPGRVSASPEAPATFG
ncbi:MAG TPA: asparagine synthase (glutamine-hydrolyzing) [Thermoanaerobaculia bacterium]|nr:asparagine synthase (glutamine-hydrolyzing) [Thermoanaerobaculia bacterium]